MSEENNTKKHRIQQFWFNLLPKEKRQEIIEKEFEVANPTDAAKKEIKERYERAGGDSLNLLTVQFNDMVAWLYNDEEDKVSK